jgi:hypothetical protein
MLIICNSCGTNIEIEDTIRFVICNSCSKSLEIIKTNSSIFTKVVQQQTKKTNTKTITTSGVSIQEKIELLDNEWKNTLPNYMVQGQLPSADGHLTTFGMIFMILFGIGWIITTIRIGAPIPLSLCGVVFVFIGIWQLINHLNRTEEFNTKKGEYEKKRSQLMAKIK